MHEDAGSPASVAGRIGFFPVLAAGILTLLSCSKPIDAAQLRSINGLVYKLHDIEPFTGVVRNVPIHQAISIAGNGSCERTYKDGRLHGRTDCTGDSGHRVLLQEWEEGRRHGIERTWDPKTGKLHIDSRYKQGKRDGLYELYNPAIGKRIVRNEYRDGELEGKQQIWDAATGETLLVDMMWRGGRQTGFSKLGSVEETYRDGRLHGTRRNYTIDDPQYASALLEAQRQVELLRGGGYFMGMYPGTRVNVESVYEDGQRISHKEMYQRPAAPAADIDGCVDKWIAAHRKEVGDDAPIKADQLEEWKSWCWQGKQP